MSQPRPLPKWWYAAAFVPFLAGVAVVAVVVVKIAGQVDALQRFDTPGSGTLELPAGEVVLYGEYDGAGGDDIAADRTITCTAEDGDSGEPVALSAPVATVKYNIGGKSGRSLYELDAPRAGRYRIACEGFPGQIAVGKGVGTSIAVAVGAGFGGLALTVLAIVLVYRQRKRAVA